MKSILASLLGICCMVCHAQLSQNTIDAMTWGANTMLTLHVVDHDGGSVSNANIRIHWTYDYSNKTKRLIDKTDANGLLVLEVKSRGTFTYFVEKDGYYKSHGQYSFYVRGETRVKDGHWVPWNPTVKVVLKAKRKSTPLFIEEDKFLKFPLDKEIGFDLLKADLVEPFGTGSTADFVVRIASANILEQGKRSAAQLHLASTTEGGGLILLRQDCDSQMKSVYHAPTNGFSRTLSFFRNRDRRGESGTIYDAAMKADEYLVFRVRVEKTIRGQIIKSKYGKIYSLKFGDEGITGKEGYIQIDYYLNPEENDPNLEWNGHDLNSGRKYDLNKILAPL